jgi:hypothetical protein
MQEFPSLMQIKNRYLLYFHHDMLRPQLGHHQVCVRTRHQATK